MDDIECVWYVTQEQWDWLQELLDEPPKVNPKLRELLSRPTIFELTLTKADAPVKDTGERP